MKTAFKTILCTLILVTISAAAAHASAVGKQVNENGLVGWWTLDEGAGTVAHDFSGTGNTGTLISSPAWVSAKLGRGLNFNGSSSYVDLGTPSSLNLTTALTVAAWVKAGATFGAQIVSKGYDNSNTQWQLRTVSGGSTSAVSFGTYNNPNQIGVTSVTTLNAQTWYHLVGTYDGTTWRIYINGLLNNSNAAAGPQATANKVEIGAVDINGTPGQFWNGLIDDVRIYNRALSATEISNLYKYGEVIRKTVSTSGLMGRWTFDEGTSTIAHDFSGNNRTGTMNGMSSADWTSGKLGKALAFNNDTKYISFSDSGLPSGTSPSTMSAWIYPTTIGENNMIMWYGSASTGQARGMELQAGGTYRFFGYASDCSSGITVPANRWSQVVATYDGTTQRTYVNGVPGSTCTLTWNTVLGNGRIGDDIPSGAARRWQGVLDDARIYSRVLSASEIARLYDEDSVRIGASQENILNNGLVGYWSFNGKDIDWSANKAWDRSSSTNNGTLTSLNQKTTPAPGKVGQAFSFDGTGGYVSVPNAASLNGSSMSISGWVRLASVSGTFKTIVSKWAIGSQQQFVFQINANNKFAWWTGNGGVGGDVVESVMTPGAGIWYHFVAVANGTAKSLYINGVLDNSGTGTAIGAAAIPLTIGAKNSNVEPWNGLIDEVRVYNRALTAAEARQLYQLGR